MAGLHTVTLARQIQRVSAYGLARDDDAVLLVQIGRSAHSDAGKWMLPGGGIEHGEHPGEAAIRELEAQTGLTAQAGGLLAVLSDYRQRPGGLDLHSIMIVYEVAVTGGELSEKPDGAVAAPGWVKQADLAQLPMLVGVRELL